MTPSKSSFAQSHGGSCSNTGILLTAKIAHLIINDVLFPPLGNVASKAKYASEQAPDGGHVPALTGLVDPPQRDLCLQRRRLGTRPHHFMSRLREEAGRLWVKG